jgi:nucleoside recognition membrane protein YjiH
MVSQFVTCAIGCLIVFGFVNMYTPIFTWIGYIFVPILKLLGVPDAAFIGTNCALSMISNMTGPVAMAAAEGVSMHARFFGTVIMAPVVIFMTDFFVCLNSTKIKVNVGHMFLLWLERMILSVFLIGIASRLLFG